jgi:hypothetical protein
LSEELRLPQIFISLKREKGAYMKKAIIVFIILFAVRVVFALPVM